MRRKVAFTVLVLLGCLLLLSMLVGCGSKSAAAAAIVGTQPGAASSVGSIAVPTGPLGSADTRALDQIIGEQNAAVPEASSDSISGGQ
jgi:hypothetical protein